MRRHLLTLFIILFVAIAVHASPQPGSVQASSVQIKGEDIGYGGRVVQSGPTPVLVNVSNDGLTPLQAQVVITASWGIKQAKHTDSYSFPVTLAAGERRELELPVLLRNWNTKDVSAQLVGADGKVISATGFPTNMMPGGDEQIIILCEGAVCADTQKTIQLSGSVEENAAKSNRFRLVTHVKPRENWWAYGTVAYIVVAMPLSQLSAEQQSALEGYLRSGGVVILLESELSGSDWLAAYRTQAKERDGAQVGRGKLIVVPSPNAPELGKIFNTAAITPTASRQSISPYSRASGDYFGTRNGIHFHFPRAQWLLTAMAIYIVLIGIVNFALLRWMKRLELGWITVPVVAVLFAVFLYAYSSSQRPSSTTLDEATISWMDARSNFAFVENHATVSSPQREDLFLTAPTQRAPKQSNVLVQADWSGDSALSSIASAFNASDEVTQSIDVRQGDTTELPVSLLRWSAKSFTFQGAQRSAGTVSIDGDKLRNGTGLNFRDAILVDWSKNKVLSLKAVSDGAEIDLTKAETTGLRIVQSDMRVYLEDSSTDKPFDIREMTNQGNDAVFAGGGRVFYGLTEGPTLGAKLSKEPFVRHSAALTIVRLD